MEHLFTLDNFVTLLMLTLLQAVLGFDNLLYISLESKRAPADKQSSVRKWGIGIAIVFRIVLLFLLIEVIGYFTDELFAINIPGIVEGQFNLHGLVVLIGGAFIIYTATKEILHMTNLEEIDHADRTPRSIYSIIFWIVLMNLVFSFDSILSAMALTEVKAVMITAIVISGLLMIALADTVSEFLQKNRMYEVLGLFVLFIVGIMLLSEGGHLSHLKILGNEITVMSKGTFYFVLIVLLLTDIVQSRYQKKLLRLKEYARKQQAQQADH